MAAEVSFPRRQLPGAGLLPGFLGHQPAQLLGLEVAVVQVWQRHSRGGGRDTRGEHKTGINDAVKVPKKAVVPFGVPAVPGIQQHRSILIEYILRLKHTNVLSRTY